MTSEFLAEGFSKVDQVDDPDRYSECLRVAYGRPFVLQYKARSFELLQLTHGQRVLDIGCGSGDDVAVMAQMVMPEGSAVGVDSSTHFIQEAIQCHSGKELPVEFHIANAEKLFFDDMSFDRCRIDRVLQYISDSQAAIQEIARVLKPDGLALAYDNDWQTFTINASNIEFSQAAARIWTESFPNPRVGSHLEKLFEQAGFCEIQVIPFTSTTDSFALADSLYNLRQLSERLVKNGNYDQSTANEWLADLVKKTGTEATLTTLTAFMVVGKRPKSHSPTQAL